MNVLIIVVAVVLALTIKERVTDKAIDKMM